MCVWESEQLRNDIMYRNDFRIEEWFEVVVEKIVGIYLPNPSATSRMRDKATEKLTQFNITFCNII